MNVTRTGKVELWGLVEPVLTSLGAHPSGAAAALTHPSPRRPRPETETAAALLREKTPPALLMRTSRLAAHHSDAPSEALCSGYMP